MDKKNVLILSQLILQTLGAPIQVRADDACTQNMIVCDQKKDGAIFCADGITYNKKKNSVLMTSKADMLDNISSREAGKIVADTIIKAAADNKFHDELLMELKALMVENNIPTLRQQQILEVFATAIKASSLKSSEPVSVIKKGQSSEPPVYACKGGGGAMSNWTGSLDNDRVK